MLHIIKHEDGYMVKDNKKVLGYIKFVNLNGHPEAECDWVYSFDNDIWAVAYSFTEALEIIKNH